MSNLSPAQLEGLVRELCNLPREVEWVEFKVNMADPREIGEYISALSNAAALMDKPRAYVVWGVRNEDHLIVGTTFKPKEARKGNEELESWLLHLLTPRVDFTFHEVEVDFQHVVVLEITPAAGQPVRFDSTEWIRIGSYKKPLKGFPEKERALWRTFDRAPFEDGIAAERQGAEDVLRRLDYPAYFELLGRPLPDGRTAILDALQRDGLIAPCDSGGWNVTNLGAILFAKDLNDFDRLGRKAMRVIVYKGTGRFEAERERVEARGYASAFESLIQHVMALLPANEVIEHALRKTLPMYPEVAIRELVANALIHQDFAITGAGPMIEIFDSRIEITNPGEPLMDTDRFLDAPPTSRNEALASLTRRFHICEERGSGVDKVVFQTELFQLPAPLFQVPPRSTRAVLFAHRPLAEMDKHDRIRACYLHACLKYVQSDFLTNTSVRRRFGIEGRNLATASRLIRDAVQAGMIAPFDPNASKQQMKYVPWWAKAGESLGGEA